MRIGDRGQLLVCHLHSWSEAYPLITGSVWSGNSGDLSYSLQQSLLLLLQQAVWAPQGQTKSRLYIQKPRCAHPAQSVDIAIVNKPSFASCVVTCCSLGKFYHCPQGNGRSSSMKSGSGTSVGLTRSLNILQPRQKMVQGLFHLAHLAVQRITLHWQLHMWHCLICLKHISPPPPWAEQDTVVWLSLHGATPSSCRWDAHFKRLQKVQLQQV